MKIRQLIQLFLEKIHWKDKTTDQQFNFTAFWLIMIIATVLRLYGFWKIPFTFDEFSALNRTLFDNIGDLFEQGIIKDGHPAGVQFFLYLWTSTSTNWNEFHIKFPFIIMGIASIYFIYKIGVTWFSQSTGLLSAATLACLQYTIFHSQEARPYSCGMFLILLGAFHWGKILFDFKNVKIKNYIWWVLGASLACYTHHFALFIIGIFGLIGFFFVKKENLKAYILCAIAIVILYLPHVPIFLEQLSIGGIGYWLNKPESDFILQYLFSSFNFYLPFLLFFVGIVLFGIYKKVSKGKEFKIALACIIVFATLFLTTYFYSILFDAVLRNSGLLFAFPFLILGLFGLGRLEEIFHKFVTITLLLYLGIFSLTFKNNYYSSFYNSPYEQVIKQSAHHLEKFQHSKSFFLMHSKISNFYLKRYGLEQSNKIIDITDELNFAEFKKHLADPSLERISIGWANGFPETYLKIAKNFFPYIRKRIFYRQGAFYILSKHKEKSLNESLEQIAEENQSFEGDLPQWSEVYYTNLNDSISHSGRFSHIFNDKIEYGPTGIFELGKQMSSQHNVLEISAKVKSDHSLKGGNIVAEIIWGDSTTEWKSQQFATMVDGTGDWENIHFSLSLTDINCHIGENKKVKFYIWNDKKEEFLLDDFRISLREGNDSYYNLIGL